MRIFVNRIRKKIPAEIQFPPVFSGSRILQGATFLFYYLHSSSAI